MKILSSAIFFVISVIKYFCFGINVETVSYVSNRQNRFSNQDNLKKIIVTFFMTFCLTIHKNNTKNNLNVPVIGKEFIDGTSTHT
jgi:hypothetical protein